MIYNFAYTRFYWYKGMTLYIMVQKARPSHVMQQYITAVAVLQSRNTMITRRPGTASAYDSAPTTTFSGRTASTALTNDDPTID
jgi:hypothetical protein